MSGDEQERPEELRNLLEREALEAVDRVARALNLPEEASKPDVGADLRLVCQAYAARRERRHFFNQALFAEPAWDILLIMYCSHLAGEDHATVTSIVHAADTPYTTGLRWLKVLEKDGLISRIDHPTDGRASLIKLTETALDKMEAYLARLRSKGLMKIR